MDFCTKEEVLEYDYIKKNTVKSLFEDFKDLREGHGFIKKAIKA